MAYLQILINCFSAHPRRALRFPMQYFSVHPARDFRFLLSDSVHIQHVIQISIEKSNLLIGRDRCAKFGFCIYNHFEHFSSQVVIWSLAQKIE